MGICCSTARVIATRSPEQATMIQKSEISKTNLLENIHNHYNFISVLGHGAFGVVRKAQHIDNTSAPVAIKSILKEKIKHKLQLLLSEIETLKTVDHPNVIRLYATYEDEKYLHFVMELCQGGDIMEYIATKGVFSEKEAADVMQKLLSGVNHLHASYICHRDIKADNVLFVVKDSISEVKIVDFGLACKFGENEMKSHVGTTYYVAPEVINGAYSKECDVWSLGVLMYLLLSGRHPFWGFDVPSVLAKSAKAQYSFTSPAWSEISQRAKDLISSMLVVNPKNRITIPEALKHPWFQDYLKPTPIKVPLSVLNALKSHKAGNQLYNEAIKVIVGTLTNDEIFELRNIFRSLDTQNTGFITSDGLQDALIRTNQFLAHEEIQRIIKANDYLGEGKIKYTDFLVATLDLKTFLDNEHIWAAFKHFDANGNGLVSASELQGALERAGCEVSGEELDEIFSTYDINADNNIDFEEFKNMLSSFFFEEPKLSNLDNSVHHSQDTLVRHRTFRTRTLSS